MVSSAQRKKLLKSLQDYAENQNDGSSKKKPKHRVVVDTSVLVSALFFGGVAQDVLLHIAKTQVLILSEYIVEEFIAFASYTSPKTSRKTLRLMRQTLEVYIHEYTSKEVVKIRDANDVHIVQLAQETHAFVVASDKDLLESDYATKLPIISIDEYSDLFIV